MEFPVRSMLQYLLGTENFQYSDIYSYVFIGPALKGLVDRLKTLKRNAPDLTGLDYDERDDLDDLDIGYDDCIPSGELGIGPNGKVRVPLQDDDYLYRTGGIRRYNLLEFGILIRKRPTTLLNKVPLHALTFSSKKSWEPKKK